MLFLTPPGLNLETGRSNLLRRRTQHFFAGQSRAATRDQGRSQRCGAKFRPHRVAFQGEELPSDRKPSLVLRVVAAVPFLLLAGHAGAYYAMVSREPAAFVGG